MHPEVEENSLGLKSRVMWENIFDWLDKFGTLTTILVTSVTLAVSFTNYWTRERKSKKWLEKVRTSPGNEPVILLIDLLGSNIRNTFETARKNYEGLKDISSDDIFSVCWEKERHITEDDMQGIHEQIFEKINEVFRRGADTIHLVYAGPVAGAAVVGAYLSNGPRVVVYQYSHGEYHNMGPLRMNRH